jgi:beta-glucosidase
MSGLRKDFVWGASTSSYQIEGAVNEDGRGPSIWDARCREKGRIANGDTGDVACDHYHRFAEDVRLMVELGLGAYRFSISWPRVLPQGRGSVNEAGLAFYDRLIDALLAAGVEPWICLYHWDLPKALDDRGGWIDRDSAGWFADYAALVARRYGDRVKRFATFNEFGVFTLFGYAMDWAPPGLTDRAAHLRAIHHVNLAHGAAVDVLRALVPGVSLGAIHNNQPIWPESDKPEDRTAADMLDAHWNRAFPDPQILARYPAALAPHLEPHLQPGDMARICRPMDWFGLNYYGPIFVKAQPEAVWGFAWGGAPADAPRTEIGWPIYPDAFRGVLLEVGRRYGLPVFVTENGCGGRDKPDEAGEVQDRHRVRYLQAHTEAMLQAIEAGADVRGTFFW